MCVRLFAYRDPLSIESLCQCSSVPGLGPRSPPDVTPQDLSIVRGLIGQLFPHIVHLQDGLPRIQPLPSTGVLESFLARLPSQRPAHIHQVRGLHALPPPRRRQRRVNGAGRLPGVLQGMDRVQLCGSSGAPWRPATGNPQRSARLQALRPGEYKKLRCALLPVR